ncbi:MAG: hypothetical protein U0T82_16845 [Bacteroidales bacterium]
MHSIGFGACPTLPDIYLTPSYSIRLGSHELDLGGSFRHTDYRYGNFKFSGVDLGYYFYPNGFGKKVDFYFCLNAKIDKTRVRDILGWYMYEQAEEFDALLVRYAVGYGFRKVFLKRFYFSTDVGIGPVYQKSYFENSSSENIVRHRISVQTRAKIGYYFR